MECFPASSLFLPRRFEPTEDIPTDISTETDRVLFIKAVAEFMVILPSNFVALYLLLFRRVWIFCCVFQANKAHVELNTKNVYKADGYAVKEMLKVTSLLYSAMKTTKTALGDRVKEDNVKSKFNIAPQVTHPPWPLTSQSENKWFITTSSRIKHLSFESQNLRGQIKKI